MATSLETEQDNVDVLPDGSTQIVLQPYMAHSLTFTRRVPTASDGGDDA